MRTNIFILIIPIALFAGFVWLGISGLSEDKSGQPLVSTVGKSVPEMNLPVLDSKEIFSRDIIKGKQVLLNFFASWCLPCVSEHEFLKTVQKNTNLPIIGIVYKDKDEAIKKYLGEHGNPFASVALDRDGRGAIEWGVTGVPETFLIAPDGTIEAHVAGSLSPELWEKFFAKRVQGQ